MVILQGIKITLVGNNPVMKYPKSKKYGSNSDERETCMPVQYDLEGKDQPVVK